ncbi:conserved unknown protein [Ectocarpus siliculosus]|uniref:Uncharacterized protein n=1 Tax=Ectocarpus siliculosus TaxID=2880 RepID=D7FZ02_ECTSI|nr:conserved unknown protein [Ectocarpus siliculosus]|eukprot:CBJ32619.1 conserved unknown protein [Ectocarpus siliculosus]
MSGSRTTSAELWSRDTDLVLRDLVLRSSEEINWNQIATAIEWDSGAVTPSECRERWNYVKETPVKGPWSSEEDDHLKRLVDEFGSKKWNLLARAFPGRSGKQCRERWHNHVDGRVKKGEWSAEEDQILCEAQRQLGNKWSEMSKILVGRSENAIKNRFNSLNAKGLAEMRANELMSKLAPEEKAALLNIDSDPPAPPRPCTSSTANKKKAGANSTYVAAAAVAAAAMPESAAPRQWRRSWLPLGARGPPVEAAAERVTTAATRGTIAIATGAGRRRGRTGSEGGPRRQEKGRRGGDGRRPREEVAAAPSQSRGGKRRRGLRGGRLVGKRNFGGGGGGRYAGQYYGRLQTNGHNGAAFIDHGSTPPGSASPLPSGPASGGGGSAAGGASSYGGTGGGCGGRTAGTADAFPVGARGASSAGDATSIGRNSEYYHVGGGHGRMKARTTGFRVDSGRAWRSKRPWPSFGGWEGRAAGCSAVLTRTCRPGAPSHRPARARGRGRLAACCRAAAAADHAALHIERARM